MFNWLKMKFRNLVPSDLSKGMMSSYFGTIKLGEKLTVPVDCVCFVSYKDKIYNTLTSGTHNLSKELLIDVYQKQLKNNKQLKQLKLDLFFVNKSEFTYTFDYIDKIPVNKKSTKVLFSICANINIDNPNLFCSNILAEHASINCATCERVVLTHIEYLLRHAFLHEELSCLEINNDLKEKITTKLTKQLKKVGICLNLLKISVTSKNKTSTNSQFFKENSFNNNNDIELKNDHDIIDQTTKLLYNENTSKETAKLTHCPNCNCKVIRGSLFCHRCGKTLR